MMSSGVVRSVYRNRPITNNNVVLDIQIYNNVHVFEYYLVFEYSKNFNIVSVSRYLF